MDTIDALRLIATDPKTPEVSRKIAADAVEKHDQDAVERYAHEMPISGTGELPIPEPAPEEAPKGTHRVEFTDDGKVRIFGVELFVGFIEGFDDPEEKDLVRWTPTAVGEAVDVTQRHMIAGSRPQIVVRHDGDGRDVPPESVGTIISVAARDFDYEGVKAPGIVGTIECERGDFEQWYKSNRYPRRSAEIVRKTGQIAQVALMGREAPRRPIRDMRFGRYRFAVYGDDSGRVERRGQYDVIDRDLADLAFEVDTSGPGPNNVTVPTLVGRERKREDTNMDPAHDKDKPKGPSLEDRLKTLEASMAKLSKNMHPGSGDDHNEGADDDDAAKKKKKAAEAAVAAAGKTEKSELELRLERHEARTKVVGDKIDRMEATELVQQMSRDGYRITRENYEELIDEFAKTPEVDREKKVERFRKLIHCDPIAGGQKPTLFGLTPVPGEGGEPDVELMGRDEADAITDKMMAEAQRMAEKDDRKVMDCYRELSDKYLQGEQKTSAA